MPVKCFLLTPAPFIRRSIRRYHSSAHPTPLSKCPGPMSYHDASVDIGTFSHPVPADDGSERDILAEIPRSDPRWPRLCICGYEFLPSDEWQTNEKRLYSGHPSAELHTLRSAPPGAMWVCWWLTKGCWPWENQETPPLYVRLPNGHDFDCDGRASNCGSPEDKIHRCWVKHGEPPNITLDTSGNTCNAGAGSILSGAHGGATPWHGFLRGGELVE